MLQSPFQMRKLRPTDQLLVTGRARLLLIPKFVPLSYFLWCRLPLHFPVTLENQLKCYYPPLPRWECGRPHVEHRKAVSPTQSKTSLYVSTVATLQWAETVDNKRITTHTEFLLLFHIKIFSTELKRDMGTSEHVVIWVQWSERDTIDFYFPTSQAVKGAHITDCFF